MGPRVIVVGVSAFYHDSAVAVVVDGEVVAAAQEERFTHQRFESDLPLYAYRSCLDRAGIGPADVDVVAYYENPTKKAARQLWMELSGPAGGTGGPPPSIDARHPARQIRERLGFDGEIDCVDHHEAHAASAFYASGFEEAAVLTADAVGEWTTTSYGRGSPSGLALLREEPFPHSYGLLYSTVTAFLGFEVNSDEYKVMGLAAFGTPRYLDRLRTVVRDGTGGRFRLDLDYFGFARGTRMYSERLPELLGMEARHPGAPLTADHRDLAASVQALLEELLTGAVAHLHDLCPSDNICYAGGVALNSVANRRLRDDGPFRNWYVPAAPGDAGGSVGAALLVHRRRTGTSSPARMVDARLGPDISRARTRAVLGGSAVPHTDYAGRPAELHGHVAERLAAGDVIGWARGRMEFGPRALGARSILADPRDPAMRDRINALVKKREEFRPFAPAVVAERADEWFESAAESPFMTETAPVRPGAGLPAVTHVDGTGRLQTVDVDADPDFHALLTRFGALTGVPVLLNTSFNVRGDPISCDEIDALSCFVRAGIDVLVIGDLVIRRADIPPDWVRLLTAAYRLHPPHGFSDSYTFFL